MRKTLLNVVLPFIFVLMGEKCAQAQDIIVKSSNDSIRTRIIEINTEYIRYRLFNMREGPILQIRKNEVKEIIYENGTRLTILYNPYEVSSDMMIKEHYHALKADILSPLFNHYVLGYEIKLKPKLNLEIKASLIGTNVSANLKHAEGYFGKAGLKFVKLTHCYMRGLKYIQPLKGNYVKPELIYGHFKRDEDHKYITYTNYAFNIVFGRQDVINNFLVIDYFGGVGYSYEVNDYVKEKNDKKEVGDFSYSYSHLFFGKGVPIILSGGVLIGLAY